MAVVAADFEHAIQDPELPVDSIHREDVVQRAGHRLALRKSHVEICEQGAQTGQFHADHIAAQPQDFQGQCRRGVFTEIRGFDVVTAGYPESCVDFFEHTVSRFSARAWRIGFDPGW